METQQASQALGAPIHDAKLLPALPPGQVIGRNRELGSMHNTVKTGAPIFLSGAPGSGKTALVAVLATAYIASKNSGGVLWFNQIEDDARMLVARVGRAYGVVTYGGPDSLTTARSLLEKNRPLIILDGMVDAEAAREFVKTCAADTPVIIANELAAAGPWMPVNLGPLGEEDARAVFKYYAGPQDETYTGDIESLCRFLDGYPLTLQLAARLTASDNTTPAELMAQLPANAVRDSQQTIIALCFKRLPPPMQGLLLVLAASFAGAATAELLGDMSGATAVQVAPLMRQLVVRGLARESLVYGQPAYTLHESVQQYAVGWLNSYRRLAGLEGRALQSVATYAERHAEAANVERIAAEMPNILGAAALATQLGNTTALNGLVDAVQKLGETFRPELDQLHKLATLVSHPTAPAAKPVETSESEASAAAEPAIVEPSPAEQETQPHLPETSEEDAHVTPVLLKPAAPEVAEKADATPTGEVTRRQPSFTAFTRLSPTISQARGEQELPDTDELSDTLIHDSAFPTEVTVPIQAAETVGSAPAEVKAEALITEPPATPEDTQEPTDHSLGSLQSQLEEARAAGDKARQALILQAVGKYHLDQGDYPRAQERYQEALAIYEKVNDKDGMAASLEALALLTAQTGDPRDDLQYAMRGVEIARELGDAGRLGRLLIALGDAQLATDDAANAQQSFAQGIENLRTTEDWVGMGTALSKLGDAYLNLDQPREAIMMFEQAITIFQRESQRGQETRTIDRMAVAYALLKQWDNARTYYERALFLARERFDRPSEAIYLGALANVYRMQGDVKSAVSYFRQALHVAYSIDDVAMQGDYARELGSLLLDDTRTLAQAVELLREANAVDPDNAETHRLLGRAGKRVERVTAAGIALPPPHDSNRHFAAEAYIH